MFFNTLRNLIGSLLALSLCMPLCSCGLPAGEKAPAATNSATNTTLVAEGATDKEKGAGDAEVVALSPETEKDLQLASGPAELRDINFVVKTTGEVLSNANETRHITSPVSGRVTEVLINVGDHVHEGQKLVMLRSTDIEQAEADLLQNEAQVRADLKQNLLQIDSDTSETRAELRLSDSTYQRENNLFQEKIASRADYEAAKTKWEKDKITLDTLVNKRAATIDLSKEKMRILMQPAMQKLKVLGVSDADIAHVLKTHEVDPIVPVEAPESGVVSERLINVGELADPSKPLFTITDLNTVWLKADVYEKDVRKVQSGQPIELEVDSFPGEKFAGKLNYVADSINPDTRTLQVRAEVQNPGLKLKPKMFGHMKIFVGEHKVLAVCRSAVQDADNCKVVYVPLGAGRYREQKVDLGGESGEYFEVVHGLHAGQPVVTKGSFDLRAEALKESE